MVTLNLNVQSKLILFRLRSVALRDGIKALFLKWLSEGNVVDNRLTDLISKVLHCSEPSEGWQHVVALLRDFGASHVSVAVGRKDQPHVYRGTLPDYLNEHHDETVGPIDNPRRRHCRTNTTPCSSGSEFHHRWQDIPQEVLDFDKEVASLGGRAATLIPVHDTKGPEWGAVGFMTGLDGEKHEELFRTHSVAIVLVAHLGFSYWWRSCVGGLSQNERLSNRERECLLWLARGLRNDRIAERLNLSRATVEFHFANARRKLNAKTREQALANAITSRLICP